MGEGPEGACADATQQFAERGITGQVAAKNQLVNKEPEQVLQFGQITVGDGRADDELLLLRVAKEQHLEHRQKKDKRGDFFLLRQQARGRRVGFGKYERLPTAAAGLHRRSRSVGRQV
jgi:hypothetical protein